MIAPDPPHWTQNSCLGGSRSDWVHLAMFHYYTKLGAKRFELVQLMHKLVPWSRFGIFRNECTRSTPLDPKLVYRCVSQCLGAFWIVSLQHEAWCKTGWTGAINAKVRATKSHRYFSQHIRSTPLDPKLMFWCVSQYLGAFGNLSLLHETRSKTGWIGEINAQVRAMKSYQKFSQQTHLSHPIEP